MFGTCCGHTWCCIPSTTLVGPELRPANVNDWLERYLLAEVLIAQWPEATVAANRALLQLLIRYRDCGAADTEGWLGALLDERDVQDFLLVHRYQDCDWFNRERLVQLVTGMVVVVYLTSMEAAENTFACSGGSDLFDPCQG